MKRSHSKSIIALFLSLTIAATPGFAQSKKKSQTKKSKATATQMNKKKTGGELLKQADGGAGSK